MDNKLAVWKHQKTGKYVRGYWSYYWPGDRFNISIIDKCGLRNHDFTTTLDEPEFGKYKLVKDAIEKEIALKVFKKVLR